MKGGGERLRVSVIAAGSSVCRDVNAFSSPLLRDFLLTGMTRQTSNSRMITAMAKGNIFADHQLIALAI